MCAIKKKSRSVMVFGTFDLLHRGHLHFLREAKKYGLLTVVVARDKTVEQVKGEKPRDDERKRKFKIESAGIADKVLLGSLGNKYQIIAKEKPDIICLGYDQDSFTADLEESLESMGIEAEIRRMKAYRPEKYKTSILKKDEK